MGIPSHLVGSLQTREAHQGGTLYRCSVKEAGPTEHPKSNLGLLSPHTGLFPQHRVTADKALGSVS